MNMATSRVVLYMSMSLDGLIAGPGDTKGNDLGDGGERLHNWLARRRRRSDELSTERRAR